MRPFETGGNSDQNGSAFDPAADPLRYRYELLADYLGHLIITGQLPPNKPLLAERQLAQKHGVSLGTARHATQILRERGLVSRCDAKEPSFFLAANQNNDE
jgi:DNA-binding FadR family transcriptional regulator